MEQKLRRLSHYLWELPQQEHMYVRGFVYGDMKLVESLITLTRGAKEEDILDRLTEAASLFGVKKVLAFPSVHGATGFPEGSLVAFGSEGLISVAGIGTHCNSGIRLLSIPLTRSEVLYRIDELANKLHEKIPAGPNAKSPMNLNLDQVDEALERGAEFPISQGYGYNEDLRFLEEEGRITKIDASSISKKAKKRGRSGIGALNSGRHYVEVRYVDEIYEKSELEKYGLFEDQILVAIHSGANPISEQVFTDYSISLVSAAKRHRIPLRRRELVSAPFLSEEGQEFYSAVKACTNCSFADRQVISQLIRDVFNDVFGIYEKDIKTFYDWGYNTIREEEHKVEGDTLRFLVHRRGTIRTLGPKSDDIPKEYRDIGQPFMIGGGLGDYSYLLHGSSKGIGETLNTAPFDSGRSVSRIQARRQLQGEVVEKELASKGIFIRRKSPTTVAENAMGAYRSSTELIGMLENIGLSSKVTRLAPLVIIAG
ncbi:MAG: RtcB family protein [Candidatus Hodarchaeota archaeon]